MELEMWQRRRRRRKREVVEPTIGNQPGEGSGREIPVTELQERQIVDGRAGAGVNLLRLSELKAGEEATLHGFDAGHGLVSRLSALGFTPGARVTMMQNIGNGPLIVKVRDTRIALGRGEAMKVRVKR
jgi:ferrous iron transport protein A